MKGSIRSLLNLAVNIHRRLLPDDPQIGWSPYLWLLYLGFLTPALINTPWNSATWTITLISIPPFIFLYFRGFWQSGRKLVFNMLMILLIGMLVTPFNIGALVYFIYAGAPAAAISTPIVAIATLTLFAATMVIEAILLGLPITTWIVPSFILLLVGISNIFYCEMGRKNARLRLTQSEVSRLAAVAERERIARDLHDLLGQSLSLIAIKAELAGRLITIDSDRAKREINDLERVSREALREVRRAVSGYRNIGWKGELEKSRLTLKAGGVALQAESNNEKPLPVSVEAVLCMALREAVTNIIRHAYARQCQIQLTTTDDQVILTIQDDGRGGAVIPGNGLCGMRERVEQIGGQLQVTAPGGVTLRINIPINPNISALNNSIHAA